MDTTQHPTDLELVLRNVPACLRERAQWVHWKYILRGGKPTKVPIDPKNGGSASATNPATWDTFERAIAALQRDRSLAGIGFVFIADDSFAGVDLDGCIVDGEIVPEARAIINSLDSYTEVSPSGLGVKVFLQAQKPDHAGCRSDHVEGFDHIEVYDNKRFFAVTGRRVSDTPPTIEARQHEFEGLCDRLWPRKAVRGNGQSGNGSAPLVSPHKQVDMAAREARCIAYLEKCPDAISGQGGHNATLRAACECFRFGLDNSTALRVMHWFNGLKTAGEQWSEKELNHKLDSARLKIEAAGEMGVRLVDIHADISLMKEDVVAALTTDVGNAARLVRRFRDRIRFSYGPQQWLIWDGRRWKVDDRGTIVILCKQTALAIFDEAKRAKKEAQESLFKWAMSSQRRDRLTAMAALAQPDVGAGPDELDADPYLLNCLNGTIDLRTGELRPHSQDDLITKLAPLEYDPGAECARFDQFLCEVFDEEELISFVQRWHGHCLTGDVREQYLPIYFGQGNNGKNVLLDTISAIMGDYAGEAPPDLLTVRKHPEHPTEIADLLGKRLVIASETERDAELRLQFIKRVTGNARLKARYMRQDYFEFTRTHKMILVTNNRPVVREDSEAVWRRLRLVPFNIVIPPEQRDRSLMSKLRDEWPGILTWLVRGCVDWFQRGLAEPTVVVHATQHFRGHSNTIDAFLLECCTLDPGGICRTSDLRAAYADWCSRNHRVPLEGKAFASALKGKGCKPDRDRGQRCWIGLTVDTSQFGHD